MNISAIGEEHRSQVNQILSDEWHCPPSISKGNLLDTTKLSGFVCVENDEINGVITYNICESECEIVTLNSFCENKGIGTALIDRVVEIAKRENCKRLWLITTNDDINAIKFYQKRGFEFVAIYINSMEISRKLKPSIPFIGMNNIPIKHEIEFEIVLSKSR